MTSIEDVVGQLIGQSLGETQQRLLAFLFPAKNAVETVRSFLRVRDPDVLASAWFVNTTMREIMFHTFRTAREHGVQQLMTWVQTGNCKASLICVFREEKDYAARQAAPCRGNLLDVGGLSPLRAEESSDPIIAAHAGHVMTRCSTSCGGC
eukprot:gene37050-28235_t